jgi:predicted RNA-binding Zn-ribbon protein involved in translation (DUF1610 family)
MSEYVVKCPVCRGLVFEEELFCSNCGTEAPRRDENQPQDRATVAKHSFVCDGCGASMSYDASVQTLRCPFCGSEKLTQQADAKTLSAEYVLPFLIAHDDAASRMRAWLSKGFWRPGDLSRSAAITKMTPVYVPYWVFRANAETYWTADSSDTPVGARGDWYPLFGQNRGRYSGLLVGASGVLTPAETWALLPFDLSHAFATEKVALKDVPSDAVAAETVVVEQFRVQRKYARPQARQLLESLERDACRKFVPGRERNLKVNVRVEGMSSVPVLLPVWVMAYQYQDRIYRFLINGQTGRATGQAPTSWKKVIAAVAIVVLLALLLFLGLVAALAT